MTAQEDEIEKAIALLISAGRLKPLRRQMFVDGDDLRSRPPAQVRYEEFMMTEDVVDELKRSGALSVRRELTGRGTDSYEKLDITVLMPKEASYG